MGKGYIIHPNDKLIVVSNMYGEINEETFNELLSVDMLDFKVNIVIREVPDKLIAIKIARLIDKYPNNFITLHINEYDTAENLDSLMYISNLKHFEISTSKNYDLSIISTLEGLESFDYMAAHQSKVDISPLAKCKKLESLLLDCKLKNEQSFESMTQLRALYLKRIPLDMNLIKHYQNLEILYVDSQVQNIEVISEVKSIVSLELSKVRGLKDIEFVSALSNLVYLYLESLKEVIALPSFKENSNLAYIYLDKMHGIKNLDNLKNLPNLKQIYTQKLDMLAQDVGVFLQDMMHLYYVKMLLKQGKETMELFDIIDKLGINENKNPEDFVWCLNSLYRV